LGLVDEVRGQRICIDTAPIIYFIEHHVKYRSIIRDELVKSHIPYVVHASTKPVLSEPCTLRQAQGERWVEALMLRQAQHERNINRLSRASRDSP